MFTTKRAVILFAAIALAATACSDSGAVATVNDIPIEAEAVYPLAGCEGCEGGLDASAGRVAGDPFRDALRRLIIQEALLGAAADDYGLDDLATDAARDAYLASLSPQQAAAIQQAVNEGVQQGRETSATAEYIVTQQLIGLSVRDAILHDETFLQSVYTETPELLVNMCVSHILVETEEQAEEVVARLEAGESFAEVAVEVSLDTQSPGGALPCPTSPYLLGEEFGEAVTQLDVGLAPDPILTRFGYHVVDVMRKDQPGSFEELVADPILFVPPQLVDSEYSVWLDEAVGRAEIVVQSNVGVWFPAADAIQAPPASP
jgi:parvulin-like peptidyl-prolyl isomerase